MKSSAKHVEFLDHLRGVAILAVLLFHSLSTVFGYDVLPWKGWFRDFSGPISFLGFLPISVANVGVPIFFVVSGFCIHLSFQQQGRQWGRFFIRRVFRIYPAYLAALLFFTLFYQHHFRFGFMRQELWTQLLAHGLLFHNYQTSTIGAINGSFWSMAVEIQLYLIYPLLVFLVGKLGWRRTLILLAGIEVCIRGSDGLMETLRTTETTAGYVSWLFSISPLGFWFSWSLGAFIAEAHVNKQPLPFLKSSVVLWPLLGVVCYFIKPLAGFRFLFFALATAVVVSKLLACARPEAKAPSFWSGLLQKIGLWSYSLYLLHQPLLNVYSYAINWLAPEEFRLAPIAFVLVVVSWWAVIPFSVLWCQVFELPGIALGKRLIQKLATPSAVKSGPEACPAREQTAILKNRYWRMTCLLLLFAAGNFLLATSLMPVEPVANNNLAWALATSPDANNRNGVRAVELAEDACQRTQFKQTIMVGTLAAAYAEAGRFDEAIATAQQACALAAQNGETNLLQRNQELLSVYQNHQPYRDQSAEARK